MRCFCCKQKTAYEMRISDWSSDVCSSDLQMSDRDHRIGLMLIDAIDDDGYLRESLDAIAQSLLPEIRCSADEVLPVLHQVQRLDPVGVGARDLGECLVLQLDNLPDDTPGRVLARRIAIDHIDRLPRIGIEGVASEQIGRAHV